MFTLTNIIIAVVVVIVLWLITTYNGLVTLSNQTNEAWSDIDVQFKRQFDLIPNLVNIVKGYAAHEQGTLEKVVQARNQAMGAGNLTDKGQAENLISGALKSIFALSESYPDLKANQNFLELQRELSDTIDKIQASRRFYNGNVRDLNTKAEHFPSNIVANLFGFGKREFFQAESESVKQPVEVKF